ncbi:MAG: hypothetical protein AAF289_15500 [Cyanobacteria bacterium P01_A01_bin.135]
MVPESPNPDVLQKTTERVARFIQWVVELFRRRDWFMLLVLLGVSLAIAGGFLRDRINEVFFIDGGQGPFWASFWTGVILLFVGAFAVALATMPRQMQATAADMAERKAIKGLRPFAKEDAEVFSRLQRERSLRECCEAVTSEGYKFGILLGESGCGKTSFLQAGLWPRLLQPESSHRGVYVRFSDQEPLGTIGKAVAEQLEIPPEWLQDLTFEKLLAQAVEAAGKPVVLLLDQFEQFFVHNPRQEDRKAFTKALTGWYGNPSLDRVKLVVSIRADLLHELYELQRALQYDLGPRDCFKLERFSPDEAARVLGVIAETERLECDPRFVAELAEQELAHRDTGTISPVDVQILAWMIERQKDDELRAFNRAAFQKFGGVEGLLTRFLDRTLETRVLPAQRLAAVKVLLALTDLDRQVRAGVLTVAELQRKVSGTAKLEEVTEAVAWLSRGDVRLITPQDKGGELGYELAHERLIPALMRVAGKELTEADKANQLLERRVNEWLGNGRSRRYLLGWRELWSIWRQWPYLVWGAKRRQKEALIRVSQRRASWVLGGLAAIVLVVGAGYGYLNFTVPGQIQWVRWELARGMAGNSVSPEVKAEVATALIEDGQWGRGLDLIDKAIESRSTRASAVQSVSQIAVELKSPVLLQQAFSVIDNIDDSSSKCIALSILANAYKKIDDGQQAVSVLKDALQATSDIDDPISKSLALSAIANIYGQIKDSQQAVNVLKDALQITSDINDPISRADALSDIAKAAGQIEDSQQAANVLGNALRVTGNTDDPISSSRALSAIASAAVQIGDSQQAANVLKDVLQVAGDIDIDDYGSNFSALPNIASAAGQIRNSQQAANVLEDMLRIADSIDSPNTKSRALSAVASAAGQIRNSQQAANVLEGMLRIADSIDSPDTKSRALSAVASAAGQIGNSQQTANVLVNVLRIAGDIADPSHRLSALSGAASAYGQIEDSQKAADILKDVLQATSDIDSARSKSYALSAVASAAGQIEDSRQVASILKDVLQATSDIDSSSSSKSSALSAVASAAGQIEDSRQVTSILKDVLQATSDIDSFTRADSL